jgi:hypothetical protein
MQAASSRAAEPAPASGGVRPLSDWRIGAAGAVHAYLGGGVLWDALGAAGMLPVWWPPVGYVLIALGVAGACMIVLFRVLGTPRGTPRRARLTALELAGTGLLLACLTLRGHAEIPPDAPLVIGQVAGWAGWVGARALRRRAESST